MEIKFRCAMCPRSTPEFAGTYDTIEELVRGGFPGCPQGHDRGFVDPWPELAEQVQAERGRLRVVRDCQTELARDALRDEGYRSQGEKTDAIRAEERERRERERGRP